MRSVLMLITILFVSACVTDNAQDTEYTTISIEESRMDLPSDVRGLIRHIDARSLSSLYQEVVYMKYGVFLFQRYYLGGFYSNFVEGRFRRNASNWTALGSKIDGDAFEIELKDSVHYAFFNRPSKKCVYGTLIFGQDRELVNGLGKTAYLAGFICVNKNINSDEVLNKFIAGMNKVKIK